MSTSSAEAWSGLRASTNGSSVSIDTTFSRNDRDVLMRLMRLVLADVRHIKALWLLGRGRPHLGPGSYLGPPYINVHNF